MEETREADGPVLPLCCACKRPATGKVFDMHEAPDGSGGWRWEQVHEARGFCDLHQEKHGCCRWIDRNGQVWDSEPAVRDPHGLG